jgi:hypothetical protein
MSQTLQIYRTTTNTPPAPGLLPGVLSAELGPFTKLWIGSAAPAGNRLLLSNDPLDTPIGVANYLHLAGGTMLGPIVLAADAAANLEPVSLQQLNAAIAGLPLTDYLPLAGGLMTGPLALTPAQQTLPFHAAARNQVLLLTGGTMTGAANLAGDSTAVTPAVGDNDTSIATTAFVHAAANTALNNVGRNLIHNGLFNIAQRGLGPFTANGFTVDRWAMFFVNGSMSVSRVTLTQAEQAAIGDEAAQVKLQCVVVGSATAGSTCQVYQSIEDLTRLAGKVVAVSFWAWTTVGTMNVGLVLDQNFGTGGTPSPPVRTPIQTVVVTTTPTRYSLTFNLQTASGATLGTNLDSSTTVDLYLSSQSQPAVGVQSGTINLWGVQLEIGPTATPLEKLDPQIDLANCQRFYQVGNMFWEIGGQVAGANFQVTRPHGVAMRTAPSVNVAPNPPPVFANIGNFGFASSVYEIWTQGQVQAADVTCVIICTVVLSADL